MIDQTTIYGIIDLLPAASMESVTLRSRGARETGYTSVTYANTRRKPANNNEVMMAGGGNEGEEWIEFQLYKTTEATKPKLGDAIIDAESITWQIKRIKAKMMQTAFFCTCLKNK